MYDSIDDVVWLRKQIEIEQTMRIDLARIQAKVIAKLEKKNSKQKKQIANLVERLGIAELDNKKLQEENRRAWGDITGIN